MFEKFKLGFKALSFTRKMILIGAMIGAISVFLPWYSDLDRFNVGDTFLGISGPLYLAGLITLFAFTASGTVIVRRILKKPVKLPSSEGNLHVATAVLALLMLVLTNSVYFHPKFGISLADKEVGFGMMMAIIGLALMGGFAILGRKERVEYANVVSIDEPIFEEKLKKMQENRDAQKIEISKETTVEEAIEAHKQRVQTSTNDINY